MKPYLSLGIIFFIACIIVYAILNYFLLSNKSNFQTLTINGQQIIVEMAKTKEQQIKGLANRNNLPVNQGMLFVFLEKQSPFFWMKDMKFPIDIIWLDNSKIVKIDKNIPTISAEILNPQYYQPPMPINYVLEVNANFTSINNIKVGDVIDLSNVK